MEQIHGMNALSDANFNGMPDGLILISNGRRRRRRVSSNIAMRIAWIIKWRFDGDPRIPVEGKKRHLLENCVSNEVYRIEIQWKSYSSMDLLIQTKAFNEDFPQRLHFIFSVCSFYIRMYRSHLENNFVTNFARTLFQEMFSFERMDRSISKCLTKKSIWKDARLLFVQRFNSTII